MIVVLFIITFVVALEGQCYCPYPTLHRQNKQTINKARNHTLIIHGRWYSTEIQVLQSSTLISIIGYIVLTSVSASPLVTDDHILLSDTIFYSRP